MCSPASRSRRPGTCKLPTHISAGALGLQACLAASLEVALAARLSRRAASLAAQRPYVHVIFAAICKWHKLWGARGGSAAPARLCRRCRYFCKNLEEWNWLFMAAYAHAAIVGTAAGLAPAAAKLHRCNLTCIVDCRSTGEATAKYHWLRVKQPDQSAGAASAAGFGKEASWPPCKHFGTAHNRSWSSQLDMKPGWRLRRPGRFETWVGASRPAQLAAKCNPAAPTVAWVAAILGCSLPVLAFCSLPGRQLKQFTFATMHKQQSGRVEREDGQQLTAESSIMIWACRKRWVGSQYWKRREKRACEQTNKSKTFIK